MLFYPSPSLHSKHALRSSDSETDTEKQKCKVVISTVPLVHLEDIGAFLHVKFASFPGLMSDVYL